MPGQLYIASSLHNRHQVCRLRDRFWRQHQIALTHDWTVHGSGLPSDQLAAIAHQEALGVLQARCLLLVFPARRGSHFEAGLAFARQIPIVLLHCDPAELDASFHHMPELLKCTSETEAVSLVLQILDGSLKPYRDIQDHLVEQYDSTTWLEGQRS